MCATTANGGTLYECEAKEAAGLEDGGALKPYPQFPHASRRFMVDKNSGLAIGEIFPFRNLIWKLIEQGSKTTSFKVIGFSAAGQPAAALTILEYRENVEKPFVLLDIQIGSVTTGLCR